MVLLAFQFFENNLHVTGFTIIAEKENVYDRRSINRLREQSRYQERSVAQYEFALILCPEQSLKIYVNKQNKTYKSD